MKKLASNGFTLVEIIISIAILGIVAVGVLPGFLSGFKIIIKSGDRSSAALNTQAVIEQDIRIQPTHNEEGNINMTIDFSSDSSNITIEGRVDTETSNVRNNKTTYSVFVPVN